MKTKHVGLSGIVTIVVFSSTLAGAQDAAATLTILHDFTPGRVAGGPAAPAAGLIQASDGNFYGTTEVGGSADRGTVFRMAPDGTVTTLHSFTGGADGANPWRALMQASDGNLYGTTLNGGAANQGTVFRMTTSGSVSILHAFTGGADGGFVLSELIEASDGNIYGTTGLGGSANQGTVFRMAADGTLTTLYSFPGPPGGAIPNSGLIQAADGNFYGTTPNGGTAGRGTVFRMTPSGTVTVLHSFQGVPDGSFPNCRVIQALDGNFYGVTSNGGTSDAGALFRMSPAGDVSIMHSFTGSDGPFSALIQTSDLHLYGTVAGCGVAGCFGYAFRMGYRGIFEIVGPRFTGTNTGNSLIQGRDGDLYGTGRGDTFTTWGVVYRLSGFARCEDTLTASYAAGTLNLGFTLMTTAASRWEAWIVRLGPPEQATPLWSIAVPAISPAMSFNVPVEGFPSIGNVLVVTTLRTPSVAVCGDWKLVDTGP